MTFLENCRRLVSLETTPSHGNLSAAEFFGHLCQEADLFVEYQRESFEGVDECNIIARPQADMPAEELLLQTHLDTVHAGHFSHWTKTQSNPFNASIYNDVLYGLGVADSKLDALCKLEAIKTLKGRALRIPFVMVATFGAQKGMSGAIRLIRRKKLNAKYALVGEPTQMQLVHGGSGLAVVEISIPFSEEERNYRRSHDLLDSTTSQSRMFSGKAAHSSDPGSGENAIMKLLAYLSNLPDGVAIMDIDGGIEHNTVPANSVLEIDTVAGFRDPILPKLTQLHASLLRLEQELKTFREDGFSPPHPTMNLGMVRTFADEIRITGSCRLPPTVTDAVYEGWMSKLQSSVQEVGGSFRIREYRKGFLSKMNSGFVQTCQEILREMGLDAKPHKLSVATEATVFSRLGVECLVWGPGQGAGNSHAPNENVKIADLKLAIEFYKQLLERFCL